MPPKAKNTSPPDTHDSDLLIEVSNKLSILTEKMEGMEENMASMKALLSTTTKENLTLKSQLHKQNHEIDLLKNSLNERDTYARSWSMRVLNVPLHPDVETNTRVVMDTVYTSLLKPILEGAILKGEISSYPSCETLLETAHILPCKPDSTKPIQVRFYSRYWRSLIFRHRKEFAPRETSENTAPARGQAGSKKSRMMHPFFEDLTSATFKQLKTIKLHQDVSSAWTVNGTIRFKVKDLDTIFKVSSIHQTVEDFAAK